MRLQPEEGFTRADSRNLPSITMSMVSEYLSSDDFCPPQPEMRYVKMVRSGRKSYGDEAVGYVQLKREHNLTHCRARLSPENRVRLSYSVHAILDEVKGEVLKAFCEDCAACLGGCKHAVAFLFWLHRKTFEPSSTSIENYWIKPPLSKVGVSVKLITAPELQKQRKRARSPSSGINEDIKKLFFDATVAVQQQQQEDVTMKRQLAVGTSISMHHLALQYELTGPTSMLAEAFLTYCRSMITNEACEEIAAMTELQSLSAFWHDFRYGRITASILYEASRCRKGSGSMANSILGASSFFDTAAMKRGRELEAHILEQLATEYDMPMERKGLVLRKEFPVFGASPDGILGERIVEVKCPSVANRWPTYFNKDRTAPSKKYFAQMQLQMLMCRKRKGLYVVADVDYNKDTNPKITTLEVDFKINYLFALMRKARTYWCRYIFPRLMRR